MAMFAKRSWNQTFRRCLVAFAFAASTALASAQDPDDEKPPEKPAAKKPGAKKPAQPPRGRPGGGAGQAGGVQPGQAGPANPGAPQQGGPGAQAGGGGLQIGGAGGGAGRQPHVPNTGVNDPGTDGVLIPGQPAPAQAPGANAPARRGPDGYEEDDKNKGRIRPPGTGGPMDGALEGIRGPGGGGGGFAPADGGPPRANRPDGYEEPPDAKGANPSGPQASPTGAGGARGTQRRPGEPEDGEEGRGKGAAAGAQGIDPRGGQGPGEEIEEPAGGKQPADAFTGRAETETKKASTKKDSSGSGNGALIFAVAIIVGLVLVAGMVALILAVNKSRGNATDLYDYGYEDKPRPRRRAYGRT